MPDDAVSSFIAWPVQRQCLLLPKLPHSPLQHPVQPPAGPAQHTHTHAVLVGTIKPQTIWMLRLTVGVYVLWPTRVYGPALPVEQAATVLSQRTTMNPTCLSALLSSGVPLSKKAPTTFPSLTQYTPNWPASRTSIGGIHLLTAHWIQLHLQVLRSVTA